MDDCGRDDGSDFQKPGPPCRLLVRSNSKSMYSIRERSLWSKSIRNSKQLVIIHIDSHVFGANKKLKISCFLLELITLHSWLVVSKLSHHFHYFGMWHITDSNGVSDP